MWWSLVTSHTLKPMDREQQESMVLCESQFFFSTTNYKVIFTLYSGLSFLRQILVRPVKMRVLTRPSTYYVAQQWSSRFLLPSDNLWGLSEETRAIARIVVFQQKAMQNDNSVETYTFASDVGSASYHGAGWVTVMSLHAIQSQHGTVQSHSKYPLFLLFSIYFSPLPPLNFTVDTRKYPLLTLSGVRGFSKVDTWSETFKSTVLCGKGAILIELDWNSLSTSYKTVQVLGASWTFLHTSLNIWKGYPTLHIAPCQ